MKFWWSVERIMRKLLAGFIEIALGKTKTRERNTHWDGFINVCLLLQSFSFPNVCFSLYNSSFSLFFLLSSNWPLFHKMCALLSPEIATDKVIFYLSVIISTVLSALRDLGHWANTGRGNHLHCSVVWILPVFKRLDKWSFTIS